MKPILSTLRLCGLSVAILLLFATVAPAAAQQVRTVGETLVHLDPDPESPTIATLPAGTDLTWVGESGEWYTVSFTGPAGDDLLGYVRAGEVQVMGAPSAPPAAPGAGGPPLMGGGGGGSHSVRANPRRPNPVRERAQPTLLGSQEDHLGSGPYHGVAHGDQLDSGPEAADAG